MRMKRLIAALLAAALPVAMTGCFDLDLDEKNSSFSYDEEKDEKKDKYDDDDDDDRSGADSGEYLDITLDTIREHAQKTLDDAEISGNAEVLEENIDVLLNDVDTAFQAYSKVMLDYYTDWDSEELEEAYDDCYEVFYVGYELASYAFHNCYMNDEYKELFEPYIIEDYLEYYTTSAMSMKRLEGYAKVDYETMYDTLDAYYEIVEDEELDDDEKNLKAAQIYLDVLSVYTPDTFYDSFNRDFSPDVTLELGKIVSEKILPAQLELGELFYSQPESEDVYDDPVLFDEPFETINEYAGRISPELGQSAQRILDKQLFAMASGDDSYNGSFNIDLPLDNESLIYLYRNNDFYDFTTAVHEFGHFHASFADETPMYLARNNIDIAEVHSQGLEILFMEYYDELYGDQSEEMQLMEIYNLLDSVLSGFAIGEFEYTVLRDYDSMTPEKVVECFDSIMEKYGYGGNIIEFYYITHIFEQPGYYISYGVSALAALDIWQTALSDYDKASQMYCELASIPTNAPEVHFMSALEQCGFEDVLNEDYIISLAEDVEEYCGKF